MDDDLSEFYEEFYEESFEHIENIESILVKAEDTELTAEDLDAIFRGIHSIKGGCGMFDFTHLAHFAHNFETLMDEIRQGRRAITDEIMDLLLEGNDAIRQSIEALQKKDLSEQAEAHRINQWILALLSQNNAVKSVDEENASDPTDIEMEIARSIEQLTNNSIQENVLSEVEPVSQIEIHDEMLMLSGGSTDHLTQKSNRNTNSRCGSSGDSIRIYTSKIDTIINQIGELVITKSMLTECYSTLRNDKNLLLENSLIELEHNVRELQESIMELRMVAIDSIFKRFPRLVRDVAKQLGKEISLTIEGGETEIDKNMVEKLTDPLVHLMRNAIGHGIESKDERVRKGKDKIGNIALRAYHKGGAIMIDITDDGQGIHPDVIFKKALEKGMVTRDSQLAEGEIYDLLFQPGFSTANEVSDLSGRGVGMDVVKRNLQELGGSIEVSSVVDEGTCFSIRLPLTLSIIDGQLFRVEDHIYIIPIPSIVELIQVEPDKIKHIAGQANEVHKLREHYIPIIRLNELIAAPSNSPRSTNITDGLLIVVESKKKKLGLYVNELLSQQQVVMKSLEENFRRVKGIPAATILGDGKVALIVDVDGLYELSMHMDVNKKASKFIHEPYEGVEHV